MKNQKGVNRKNYEKKQKAVILHMQGETQLFIAKTLQVTPKTAAKWLFDVKYINYQTLLANLYKKLNNIITCDNSTATDIYNLNNVIRSIEKKANGK